MTALLVETTDLTKRYGPRAAVDHVGLRVRRGEADGFLGPNGAGKTTTLRLLLGLVRASSGTARVLGTAPGDPAALARIGMLVESPTFHRTCRGGTTCACSRATQACRAVRIYLGGCMTIAGRAVLVTGANRGIGQALVEEALSRGAKRVYAGTRQPLAHPDGGAPPLTLDGTSAAQTQGAVEQVESLDLLINNAGVGLYDDLSDRAALERHLAVNLFGTYGVTQAFVPLLTRSRGAIVNVLSVTAFAPIPVIPAYSISKAAAFNLTQSLRALLAGRGVRVHAVLTGPVDTDMVRDLDIPKTSPESVASAILDGVEAGEEDIFPDPMSQTLAEGWRSGAAKALERQNAALGGAPAAA